MLNILIPIGKMEYFDHIGYTYPKPLIEVAGKPLIEHVVESLKTIGDDIHFIFVINKTESSKYHFDSTLQLITEHNCTIINLESAPKGAACSAMMAIEYINNDQPLVISNSDHVFDCKLSEAQKVFGEEEFAGGLICFDSVHPKWSFARLNEDGEVIETAEKNPLSRNAIAGYYYFRQGSYFVECCKNIIRKDVSINGNYFISPVYNELILQSKKIGIYKIPVELYHNFYAPQKINEYEKAFKK